MKPTLPFPLPKKHRSGPNINRQEGRKNRETGGSEKRVVEAADENDSRSRMGSRKGIITRASSDREKRGSRV